VFVIAGVEIRWQQIATGAWLACGPRSVLSFSAASAVWDFTEQIEVADVTVPATHRRAHPGVRVHKSRRLDAVGHRGFRVTSPMRTLLDLAAVEGEDRLARLLDLAHRRRLVDLERFRAYWPSRSQRRVRGRAFFERWSRLGIPTPGSRATRRPSSSRS
jgi:hypothetical protein